MINYGPQREEGTTPETESLLGSCSILAEIRRNWSGCDRKGSITLADSLNGKNWNALAFVWKAKKY